MALADALEIGAAALQKLADQMQGLSGAAVKVTVTSATDDRAEAEAIKRGQKPEVIAAMRKQLGL
jgi:hypothetical protein